MTCRRDPKGHIHWASARDPGEQDHESSERNDDPERFAPRPAGDEQPRRDDQEAEDQPERAIEPTHVAPIQ